MVLKSLSQEKKPIQTVFQACQHKDNEGWPVTNHYKVNSATCIISNLILFLMSALKLNLTAHK